MKKGDGIDGPRYDYLRDALRVSTNTWGGRRQTDNRSITSRHQSDNEARNIGEEDSVHRCPAPHVHIGLWPLVASTPQFINQA